MNTPAARREKDIIEEAVESAVKKTFAILGVDVDEPSSVEAFREDLRFGRRLRKMADHGQMAMVTVVIGGMLLALWYGIRLAIKADL